MARPIVTLILLMGFLFSTRAQEATESLKGDWKSYWKVRTEVEWDDNIYKFSSSQISRKDLNIPGDAVSGRFKDMNSISDVILSVKPKFKVKTKSGLFNRSLSISGIIDYQYYLNNPKRSNIKLGLFMNQVVSAGGTILLQAGYLPSYFIRNYLLDATDSTGRVSSSERIYHEAVYNELEFILSYRHRFVKWIVDIETDFFVRYRKRNYNKEFPGRDKDGLTGGLGLGIAPANWWFIYFGYYFESVQSPVASEILLLDEPVYQIDFNNDRDFADNNIRTETTVDRSHNSQNLEIGLTLRPHQKVRVYAGIELRYKNYTSQEPLDPNYKDRKDRRTKLRIGCDYTLFKDLFLMVEYKNITQQTNRPTDPESVGEITDYEINILRGGIQWKF